MIGFIFAKALENAENCFYKSHWNGTCEMVIQVVFCTWLILKLFQILLDMYLYIFKVLVILTKIIVWQMWDSEVPALMDFLTMIIADDSSTLLCNFFFYLSSFEFLLSMESEWLCLFREENLHPHSSISIVTYINNIVSLSASSLHGFGALLYYRRKQNLVSKDFTWLYSVKQQVE